MRPSRLFAGAIAAVAAFAFAAPAANAVTIRVANLQIAAFLPVAYAAKIASKHGINVKVTNFRRGLEAANALKAGQVDVAVGGVEAALTAIGGGAPAVIISSCTTGGVAWVSRKNAPIKTINDLKGKKFAVIRGLHELIMKAEFEKHHLTMSTQPGKADVQVFYINAPPALNVALKTGRVDAMSAPEPFPSQAIVAGYAKPLLLPYDTPLGDIPRAVFMRTDFIKAHPKEAQAYVDSLVDATKQLRDNPALAKKFALNDALKGAMTANDWDLSIKNIKFNVSLNPQMVKAYIHYMTQFGMLTVPVTVQQTSSLGMLKKSEAKYHW